MYRFTSIGLGCPIHLSVRNPPAITPYASIGISYSKHSLTNLDSIGRWSSKEN